MSNEHMPLHESSSAGTNHLHLVSEEPKQEACYLWSTDDRGMCASIFTAAGKAGVNISGDCSRAVSRSEDPANKVQLDRVLLAELGSDDFLRDPKQRGIAALAAALFQTSPTVALSIAGQQLAICVELADSDVVPLQGPDTVIPSSQDKKWDRVG